MKCCAERFGSCRCGTPSTSSSGWQVLVRITSAGATSNMRFVRVEWCSSPARRERRQSTPKTPRDPKFEAALCLARSAVAEVPIELIGRIAAAPIIEDALRFVFFSQRVGGGPDGRTPDSGYELNRVINRSKPGEIDIVNEKNQLRLEERAETPVICST